MEPGSIVSVTGLLVKTLDLVHKRREGKLKKKEAQELYARIFASLLWEVQQNLERCKVILNKAEDGFVSAGVLSFFVRDALFPDFCIMCPEPLVVSRLNELYAGFERIHHWQRLTSSLQDEGVKYILGYADDLFTDKNLHETLNQLVDAVKELSPEIQAPPKVSAPNKPIKPNP